MSKSFTIDGVTCRPRYFRYGDEIVCVNVEPDPAEILSRREARVSDQTFLSFARPNDTLTELLGGPERHSEEKPPHPRKKSKRKRRR